MNEHTVAPAFEKQIDALICTPKIFYGELRYTFRQKGTIKDELFLVRVNG